uniref:Uncharacterized protein n=1 Tax=Anopheles gambiae TaxID=7165 RepID=A0A0E3W2E1_ANOGA
MILYRSLQFLGFADDIDIIGRRTAKVCEAFSNRTQTRSSKNWNENQCDEGEVPACRRQGLGGGLGLPKLEDANALGVLERRILRTIFGSVFEHGAWRRRMNHELVELYGEPSIHPMLKTGRIRWLV